MTEHTLRSPEEFVAAFAGSNDRFRLYLDLQQHGTDALPAVREGLRHGNWQVRKWSAIYLDHHADAESLEALLPLLQDPKSEVRLWAVHSIACDTCKPGENPIDIVPLLIELAEEDMSIRVRRMATIMLGSQTSDSRITATFDKIIAEDSDRKLLLHARNGLERYRVAGF